MTQHPRWQEGYAARKAGQNRDANPYPGPDRPGSAVDQWDDGWLYADAEITRAAARPSAIRYTKDEKARH